MAVVALVPIGARHIPLAAVGIICMHMYNKSHLLSTIPPPPNLLQIVFDKVINILHFNVLSSVTP